MRKPYIPIAKARGFTAGFGKESPYVNIVVVKDGNQNSKKIKALDNAINTDSAKKFISDNYKGAVVPAF